MVFFDFPFSVFHFVSKVNAATFEIQTGYYTGDGLDTRQITGLGFQPNLVIIKDNTAGGNEGMVVKTSSMSGEVSLAWAETDAILSTNHIQSLDSDGFTIGSDADVNSDGLTFQWVAFGGSDCSATGTFCVGSYTGNGSSQSITSVGFQPDFVSVKNLGTNIGLFKTSSHSGTVSSYWSNTADLASGGISSLNATGFSVGSNASVNTNSTTYYFFAFKHVDNFFESGTYVGNGVDGNDINSVDNADLDFEPSFVFVKGTGATNVHMNFRESYGDFSYPATDNAGALNIIQYLYSAGGFQLGSSTDVNTNASTYYFSAFGGAPVAETGAGTFSMINGSYTGTGSAFSITDLPFDPDVVIIKHQDQLTDQHAVWKTRSMGYGDSTAYFSNSVGNITGAITTFIDNGFSVGTNAAVNTSGDTYYWTVFGNARNSDGTGTASDLVIGRFIGTAQDNRDIINLPISPNFITIKGLGNTFGYWRTDQMSGDLTNIFHSGNVGSNLIQALNSDGFELGGSTGTNQSSVVMNYMLFGGNDCSETGKFCVGTYTGNGSIRSITSVGFQPDLVWTKKRTGGTGRVGLLRMSSQTGDTTSAFTNIASLTGEITNLISEGFSLGAGTSSNDNGFIYDFAAWDAKEYNQSTYRFFENTDSTDVGAVLGAQNTPVTLSSPSEAFRLRMTLRVDYGNLFASGKDFKLQYVDKGSGTCASPTGGTPASYTDVTSGTLIAFNNNPTPSDDSTLTSNANDPTDSGRTIVNQSYIESNSFTNNQASITNQNQSGKWDFSLIDNGAPEGTTYCFRVVGATSATPIHTYSAYPEITTASNAIQEISMTISDNSIGFGTLSSSAARFATGDTLGSSSDSSDAHTISASTNADGGYVITLNGTTLQCTSCGNGADINPIGSSATSSSPGTEQFGLRGIVNSGTGTVSSPYNQSSQFAFDSTAFPDVFATGAGDNTTTNFGLRYLGNISSVTDAGAYAGVLTYTITASF